MECCKSKRRVFVICNFLAILIISGYYLRQTEDSLPTSVSSVIKSNISTDTSAIKLLLPSESTNPDLKPDNWDAEQDLIKRNITKECSRLSSEREINLNSKSSSLRLNNFLVDEKHKLLYCYIPKVACTQWKRIILLLTGNAPKDAEAVEDINANYVHYHSKLKSLKDIDNFQPQETNKILETYTKMMIVRHPLERLYSAYKNKFAANTTDANNFKRAYAKRMMSFSRKIKIKLVPNNGTGLTFEEYLDYLGSFSTRNMQEHWKPMYELCYPCRLQYDYIGHFESIEKDSNEILKRIGAKAEIKFPPQKSSTTPEKLKKVIRDVPKNILSKLYLNYLPDWTLFGYKNKYIQLKSNG